MSALDKQVAGGHYKGKAIQPVEYIHANNLSFLEGCIVKRITRWRDKDGFQDLEKIKHEVDLLIELEQKNQKAEAEKIAAKLAEAEKKRAEEQVRTAKQAKSIFDQFDPFSREYWKAPEPSIKAYMEHDGPGGLVTSGRFGPISITAANPSKPWPFP